MVNGLKPKFNMNGFLVSALNVSILDTESQCPTIEKWVPKIGSTGVPNKACQVHSTSKDIRGNVLNSTQAKDSHYSIISTRGDVSIANSQAGGSVS